LRLIIGYDILTSEGESYGGAGDNADEWGVRPGPVGPEGAPGAPICYMFLFSSLVSDVIR